MNERQPTDGQRIDPVKDAVKREFGRHADKYVTSDSHAKGTDLQRLVAYLQPASDELALDIATGGGHVANALAARVRQVVALDLTPRMLAAAQKHAGKLGRTNIVFMAGDAESLPFSDASFDLVTCRIAPHHFPHPERFVQEVTRVLKPGGRFGLTDNVSPEEPAAADFINEVEKLRDVSHVWCPSVSAWKRWLRESELTLLQEEEWTKTYHFADWVARTAETPEQQEAVAAKLLSASDELSIQFAVEREGGEVLSFQTVQWMAVCLKPDGRNRFRE